MRIAILGTRGIPANYGGFETFAEQLSTRLVERGHEVTVYNRTATKAEQWAKQFGGKTAPTPKAAAQGQDFVMCCVGNDNDLREVTLGKDGAFQAMGKGTTFVDHTTASAEIARELFDAAKKSGFDFIDAPVSGGQAGAENGVLTVMCGGEQGVFDKANKQWAAQHKELRELLNDEEYASARASVLK